MPTGEKPKSYHHGDLRTALINAAMGIVRETGRWDFSLREVAKAAEVSHNAPYGHFSDKSALLAAVGAQGYGQLRASMLAASQDLSDPLQRLQAIGTAYIRFGLENRALYKLMFGQDLKGSELLLSAADQSRQVLADVIADGGHQAVFDIEGPEGPDIAAAVLAAWSLVHGFTLLAMDGWADRETGADIESLSARISFRFMNGLMPKRRE